MFLVSFFKTFLDFDQVRWFRGPPDIFFFNFFSLQKLLVPSIFLLRKRCAKEIADERFTENISRAGHYLAEVERLRMRKNNVAHWSRRLDQ